MKKCTVLYCLLAVCLMLSSCFASPAEAVRQPEERKVASLVETADPEKALEEIYAEVDIMGVGVADEDVLQDKFGIDTDMLDEFHVRYASGRFGVADVFLLRPSQDQELKVREMLEQIKLLRIREFENYDIQDSYRIAQNAQIYEQGDYLVLLMLADNERARDIIDNYLPKVKESARS